MKPPLFVRSLTEEEQVQLGRALRSSPSAFGLRRAQYLLASARGLTPRQIAATYGGCEQTVRNAIRAFHATGLQCLEPGSHRPRSVSPAFSGQNLERLQHLLHQSPRAFGKDRGTWTQCLLAQVAQEQGWTGREHPVSDETIRRALKRLGANWKRAGHWVTSPDPRYAQKKSGASA